MPFAANENVKIYFEILGEGEPLLFLPGLGCQMVQCHPNYDQEFVKAGFQVIKVDHRDVGLSTHFTNAKLPSLRRALARRALGRPVRSPYSLSDMARDAIAVVDEIGLSQVSIFGVSMGAMIGQEIALQNPSRVRSLVSVMSSPGGVFYARMRIVALRALLAKTPTTLEESIQGAIQFSRATAGKKYQFSEQYLQKQAEIAWERDTDKTGSVRQFLAIFAASSRMRRLRSLMTKTLVIHGTDDSLILPSAGRAMAKAMPNASFKLIPGMGHELPPELAPDICRMVWETIPATSV